MSGTSCRRCYWVHMGTPRVTGPGLSLGNLSIGTQASTDSQMQSNQSTLNTSPVGSAISSSSPTTKDEKSSKELANTSFISMKSAQWRFTPSACCVSSLLKAVFTLQLLPSEDSLTLCCHSCQNTCRLQRTKTS